MQRRPSTHQLSAKYAAMLPLGAMDPSRENKDAAARQLREWVHSRRQAVQQKVTAAAAAGDGGARGGGSTLQDMPEMILPYGVYILAHHPDFPQVIIHRSLKMCCLCVLLMLFLIVQLASRMCLSSPGVPISCYCQGDG